MRRKSVCFRAIAIFSLAAAICFIAGFRFAAARVFDNGGGDNAWETATNWAGDQLPLTTENAEINNITSGGSLTVNVSSAQSITTLSMASPSGTGAQPGTATLNILPQADLQMLSSTGAQIGRALKSGQLAGSSGAVINQTGGTLTMTTGTNGMRMSNDSGTVADSIYNLSGGSVRGGTTNGSITGPLILGGLTNTYNRVEFHMIGSGPTEARFEDIRMQAGPSGTTVLHFTLDNNGVTPMTAEDELRFSGTNTNSLQVDLAGLPPTSDIMLITADRITTASSAPTKTFTNLPDGSPIEASFGGFTYDWNLRYNNGAHDDGILDAFVKLEFVSKSAAIVPGDFNLDGLRTADDVQPMFEALTNPAQYLTDFPQVTASELQTIGDVNQDLAFDNLDIQSLLGHVIAGNAPPIAVPEPCGFVLAIIGSVGWCALRTRKRKAT